MSSTLETRINYGGEHAFETFPFPPDEALGAGSRLDRVGKALDDARAAYCIDRDQGLTATYNDLKDPSVTDPAVVHLRELHVAVDRAVIEAYGWQDVPVPRNPGATGKAGLETMPLIEAIPPFTDPVTDEERLVHQRFEDAVIDQLFALNALRAAEEARPSAEDPRAPPGRPRASSPTRERWTYERARPRAGHPGRLPTGTRPRRARPTRRPHRAVFRTTRANPPAGGAAPNERTCARSSCGMLGGVTSIGSFGAAARGATQRRGSDVRDGQDRWLPRPGAPHGRRPRARQPHRGQEQLGQDVACSRRSRSSARTVDRPRSLAGRSVGAK
jgi:hypothetical protein